MQEEHAKLLFFPLAVVIFLVNIVSWKGNLVLDTSVKPTVLTKYFPQTEIVYFFLWSKDQGPERNLFVAHPLFGNNLSQ